jgi:hypothetical protein
MNLRGLFSVILIVVSLVTKAENVVTKRDSVHINKMEVIDVDSLLQRYLLSRLHASDSIPSKQPNSHSVDSVKSALSSQHTESKVKLPDSALFFKLPDYIEPIQMDFFILTANPLFIDLVYMGLPLNFDWNLNYDFRTLYWGQKKSDIGVGILKPIEIKNPDQIIRDLRSDARRCITRSAANLYFTTYDKLPDPNGNKSHFIEGKPLREVRFVEDDNPFNRNNRKLVVQKAKLGPWRSKANGMVQFSQNYVSPNWYQGGNNNLAILGILSGQLNYDDKKSVQWENSGEWRMGFNSVDNDNALRPVNVNEDIFKINSKLGVKAGGNWFYSGSVDFSTQFLQSYKSLSSTEMKTAFLTPVRLNIGVGFDYKYKKLFSVMVSPVSYKYIYVADTINVNQNLFGIKKGENYLSQIGSLIRAQVSYSPLPEIQLDSKFSFYTNYEKVEIDLEVVCNFTINRFLSTRISVNPRYDNTVILANPNDRAKMQFKQLMSIGFAHKFR